MSSDDEEDDVDACNEEDDVDACNEEEDVDACTLNAGVDEGHRCWDRIVLLL